MFFYYLNYFVNIHHSICENYLFCFLITRRFIDFLYDKTGGGPGGVFGSTSPNGVNIFSLWTVSNIAFRVGSTRIVSMLHGCKICLGILLGVVGLNILLGLFDLDLDTSNDLIQIIYKLYNLYFLHITRTHWSGLVYE